MGAVPATTCSSAMANSSGLKERPSRTSRRGVVARYQGSIQSVSAAHSIRAELIDLGSSGERLARIAQLCEQLFDTRSQIRQFVPQCAPDSFVVYLGVAVNENVAHRDCPRKIGNSRGG